MFGKSSYGQTMTAPGAPGTRSRAAGYDTRPTAINPLLAQVITATVGGTADDGDYTFTLVDWDGNEAVITFTRGAGETNTQIAAGLAARVNAISWPNDAFAASSSVAVATLAGKIPGQTYTFKNVSAPGTGTLDLAVSQAAGGTDIAPGRLVKRKAAGNPATGDQEEVTNLTGADAVTAIWGLAEQVAIPRAIKEDGTVDRNHKPGERLSVATRGHFWVTSETALSTSDTVYARFTAGAGEDAGTLRNDADGGDAKDVSANVKVIQGTDEAGGAVEISIDFGP